MIGIARRFNDHLLDGTVFLVTLAILAWGTHRVVFLAGNDASRWAHIESLVDRHRANIDQSRYHWTADKVQIDGLHYSNKPPLMAVIGAGVYAIIEWCTRPQGKTFATHEGDVVWLITMVLVGIPTAALMTAFHWGLRRIWGMTGTKSILLTAVLGLGTLIGSFSVTLNNHTPAACFLFLGFLNVLVGRRGWLSGFWSGLAIGIDLLPGLMLAPLWVILTARKLGVRQAACFLGVLAGWLVLLGAINWLTTGTVLTPKMHPRATDPTARPGPMIAGVALPDDPVYPVFALFGYHGVFSVSPVLAFGVWGMVRCWRTAQAVDRWATALTGAGCAALLMGHALFVGWYGGWSYGFRYLIPIVPVLLYFVPAAGVTEPGLIRGGFILATIPSVLFALLGAYHPWPPAVEQVSRWASIPRPEDLPTNPVGVNAAAWCLEHFPHSGISRALGRMFVQADRGRRNLYLADFYLSKQDVVALHTLILLQAEQGDLNAAIETAVRAYQSAISQGRDDVAGAVLESVREIGLRRQQTE